MATTPAAGSDCNRYHTDVDESASLAIGIDIGTQVCSAALLRDGGVTDVVLQDVVETGASAILLPSYVSVTGTGFEVGAEARKRALAGDPNTVFDFVRLVGRKLKDFGPSDFAKWPFKVVESEDTGAAIVEVSPAPTSPTAPTSSSTNTASRTFRPEELVAVLVRCIKEKAELQAQARVDSAVVCVPGDFNHTQRQAVRTACEIVGLRVDKLLSGPTAAAISYAHVAMATSSCDAEDSSSNNTAKLLLTVDIGARSADFALVSILADKFEVKAVDCDPNLGGDAFTDRIAAHCLRKKTEEPEKGAEDQPHVQRRGKGGYSRSYDQIRHACELAKKLLSSSQSAIVGIDFPEPDAFRYYTVTRPSFEALCEDLWQQLLERVRNTVQESYIGLKEIDTVLLVGGSTRIPQLEDLFRECFPDQRVVTHQGAGVTPARGCALFCGTGRRSIELSEVTPLALGIQSIGGTRILMIPRNTQIPVRDSFLYYANCPSVAMVRIVEGRSFSRSKDSDVHLLATLRVDDSLAPSHPVLKIDIAFEIASLDELVVSAAERSTGRAATRLLCGDDTSLSLSAVARARARLYNQIDDATEIVYVPRSSMLQIPHLTGDSLLSTEHPVALLRAYVRALESAIASDAFDSELSCKDRALVCAVSAELAADSRPDPVPAHSVASELPEFV